MATRIVEEKLTLRDRKFIAVDDLRAMFTCYTNLVNDNAMVPPGIGNGLRDYEERFKTKFNELLDLIGVDKTKVGFKNAR